MKTNLIKQIVFYVIIGIFIGESVNFYIFSKQAASHEQKIIAKLVDSSESTPGYIKKDIQNVYTEVLNDLQKELIKENFYIGINIIKSHPKLIVIKDSNQSYFSCSYFDNGILTNLVNRRLNGYIVLNYPGEYINKKEKKEFDKLIYNALLHELSHFIGYRLRLNGWENAGSEYVPSLIVYALGKNLNTSNPYYSRVSKHHLIVDIPSYGEINKTLHISKKLYSKTLPKVIKSCSANNKYNLFYPYFKNRILYKHPCFEYYLSVLAQKDSLQNKRNFLKAPIREAFVMEQKRMKKIKKIQDKKADSFSMYLFVKNLGLNYMSIF